MPDPIGTKHRVWGIVAMVSAVSLMLGLEIVEEPEIEPIDLLLELLDVGLIVLASLGALLLVHARRHYPRREHGKVFRDLEQARAQGRHWRNDARSFLAGFGEAMEEQFVRWNLSEGEREVALLLLKGLGDPEMAAVRNVGERTIREQARAIYAKSGLRGRVAFTAFFLEDLLVPVEGAESGGSAAAPRAGDDP